MELTHQLYNGLLIFGLLYLTITICFCLLRAVLGPLFTDRIVAVNVIGIKTLIMICVLAFYMEEDYLLDISVVYALISFLAVVVLSKVYLTDYDTRISGKKPEEEDS